MSILEYLLKGSVGLLGNPRPILTENITDTSSELLTRYNSYDYALTISPKSTKRLMGADMSPLPIQKQYALIYVFMKELLNKYNCRYNLYFEIYADGENLHLHGCIRPHSLKDIPKIKRSIYLYFTKQEKPPRGTKYSPLIDCNKITSTDSWTKYCTKDQSYIITNQFFPLISL